MTCEQCGGTIGVRTLPRYEDDGLVGLAFTAPIMLDRSATPTN